MAGDLITVPVTGAALQLLVLMQEGGTDTQCPADLPYRVTDNTRKVMRLAAGRVDGR